MASASDIIMKGDPRDCSLLRFLHSQNNGIMNYIIQRQGLWRETFRLFHRSSTFRHWRLTHAPWKKCLWFWIRWWGVPRLGDCCNKWRLCAVAGGWGCGCWQCWVQHDGCSWRVANVVPLRAHCAVDALKMLLIKNLVLLLLSSLSWSMYPSYELWSHNNIKHMLRASLCMSNFSQIYAWMTLTNFLHLCQRKFWVRLKSHNSMPSCCF